MCRCLLLQNRLLYLIDTMTWPELVTYPNYDLRRNCQFQAQAMFFDYAAFVNLSLTNKYWSSTAQFDTLSNVNRGITTNKKFPVCIDLLLQFSSLQKCSVCSQQKVITVGRRRSKFFSKENLRALSRKQINGGHWIQKKSCGSRCSSTEYSILTHSRTKYTYYSGKVST